MIVLHLGKKIELVEIFNITSKKLIYHLILQLRIPKLPKD
jgi:hypothetical protein